MAADHYKSSSIRDIVQKVTSDWKELAGSSADKGETINLLSIFFHILQNCMNF